MTIDDDQKFSGLDNAAEPARISKNYSRFVKVMRWGLPLFALIMMGIVLAWPELDDQIKAIPEDEILNAGEIAVGGNELLNPQYETTDAQNNPVSVRAQKAIQSQNNKNIVRLEIPQADFKTKKGENISVKALQGTYDQSGEKLFLQDDVKIMHQSNYVLNAKELRLNMKTQEAFSNQDITITGDDVELNAIGLQGNMNDGTLFFEGPATLTFHPTPKENIKQKNSKQEDSKQDDL